MYVQCTIIVLKCTFHCVVVEWQNVMDRRLKKKKRKGEARSLHVGRMDGWIPQTTTTARAP